MIDDEEEVDVDDGILDDEDEAEDKEPTDDEPETF